MLAATFANIFTAPAEAFRALREAPRVLVPLLALVVLNAGLVLYYYGVVDVVWLTERNMQNAPVEMTAEQREQAIENVASTPPLVLGGFSAAAAAVAMLLWCVLPAAYLTVVSVVTNDGFRFKQWLSLVAWCSLPLLLATLASFVNVAVGDATHLPAERLNPLAFANLLGLEPAGAASGSALGGIARTADPTWIWYAALVVLGYRAWTGKTLETAALVVLSPVLILVALGALISLL